MSEYRVPSHSRPAACGRCGAEVVWTTDEHKRGVPLDPSTAAVGADGVKRAGRHVCGASMQDGNIPSTPSLLPDREKGVRAEFPLTMVFPAGVAVIGQRLIYWPDGATTGTFVERTELYDTVVVNELARALGLRVEVVEQDRDGARVRFVA